MARTPAEARPKPRPAHPDRDSWARTVALVVIAIVLVLAASTQLTGLIVPLVLALVLAIALRPIAHWIERRGLGRGVSSLVCMVLVALVLLTAVGLVVAQAGRVVRDSDRYIDRFSDLASRVTDPIENSSLFRSINESTSNDETVPAGADETIAGPRADEQEASGAGAVLGTRSDWAERFRENAGGIGQWVIRSVGGVLGVLGQVIVFLALIFYILYTRDLWSGRIVRAGQALGMELRGDDLDRMGHTIGRWTGCVLMVATGYAIVMGLVSWALGLPQWPLWGLMTGFLVLVPFFGPLLAGAMLVTVAAVTSQALWPPLVMLGIYLLLQTVESYVILPMLYGEAISIDPLAVMVGVLFFGLLWGPLGFLAALPMMVLIRGFVEVTPGSAPIGALFGAEGQDS